MSDGNQDFLEELRWRGLLEDATDGAADALAEGPLTGYIGFDPTASSLHVGSLVPIMGLAHLQRAGHHAVALVGGGTGLIGDPSGKSDERQLLTAETVKENALGIHAQLEHFLDFEAKTNPARMVNNLDWLGSLRLIEFLRDVGKHFSVNSMLRKDSVKRRIQGEESGISYTEFSYQLLQSYDFYELNQRYGCTLQMGGSDQWGNITSGVDLVRRMGGSRCHGVVFPLLTTSAGTKFGKTEAGAVWLDPKRTSPFRFYQFWLNAEDGDVVKFLKFFTFLDKTTVEGLAQAVASEPHLREGQKRLAAEVTRVVHGESGLARAQQASAVLFGGSLDGLGEAEIGDIFSDVPSSVLNRGEIEGEGMGIVDLLVHAEVATSKGDARRGVEGGGIYVNNQRVDSVDAHVRAADFIEGRYLVLRKGKKRYHLVEAR